MMKRKIVCVILATVFMFTGCGKQEIPDSSETPDVVQGDETEEVTDPNLKDDAEAEAR